MKGAKVVHIWAKFHLCLICSSHVFKCETFFKLFQNDLLFFENERIEKEKINERMIWKTKMIIL